ncbi:MAG: T9SS type A sorting domain-containing protein [Saprospiraceae bacterium]|nr:T9SS type A sorting domain-containing protein [Saprospiraceae bacterium]
MKNLLLIIAIFFCLQTKAQQMLVDAGLDHHICVGFYGLDTIQLGGNPTVSGGIPPYKYEWSFYYKPYYYATFASDILDDTTIANPKIINPISSNDANLPYLKLSVIDSLGHIAKDSIKLTFSTFIHNLGLLTFNINNGDSVLLNFGSNVSGGVGTSSYLWRPNHGLKDSTSLMFWAKPDSSIAYYITVTDSVDCYSVGAPYYYINVSNVGVTEFDKEINIDVFPNPTNDRVIIDNNQNLKIKKITLFDACGKIVHISESEFSEIDLSNLKNALYILKLETEKGIIHRKIQKEQ